MRPDFREMSPPRDEASQIDVGNANRSSNLRSAGLSRELGAPLLQYLADEFGGNWFRDERDVGRDVVRAWLDCPRSYNDADMGPLIGDFSGEIEAVQVPRRLNVGEQKFERRMLLRAAVQKSATVAAE